MFLFTFVLLSSVSPVQMGLRSECNALCLVLQSNWAPSKNPSSLEPSPYLRGSGKCERVELTVFLSDGKVKGRILS
uniref:Secreted protein n=1 Tax=Anguilla anguilla TaxID=7936 RepID=A0A0E9RFX2_ANGAN